MQSQQQVKIGPEFFQKVKLDYADWRYALAREFLQNCFDAPGCKTVEVTVKRDGPDTRLTVANDGRPMSRDELENKLLTLGGSGKNFEGENTGGFGVAKSLLYYTHKSYSIWTGTLKVTGAGAQYEIESVHPNAGTTSIVTLAGDEVAALVEQFERFAAYAQWRGTLLVNNRNLACDLHKGARRRDLGWATVYTNKAYSNVCLVRLNGQPMFSLYTRFKGCVVVELTGKAKDVLTSNRDGLVGRYSSELSTFLTNLAVDKRSALREQRAEYKRYAGERQRAEARKPKAAEESLAALVDTKELLERVIGGPAPQPADAPAPPPEPVAEGERPNAPVEPVPADAGGGIKLVTVSREDEPDRTVSLGTEFILKNTTGKKIPAWWTPGPRFKGKALVRAWAAVLLKLHQIMGWGGEFSVGFVFDDESEAESERTPAYGQVYYLNPVKDGKPRFVDAWAARHEIIALAAHEVVHGARGFGEHDEDYAGALTEVLAAVAAHEWDLAELCWDGEGKHGADGEELRAQYQSAVCQLAAQEREIERLTAALAAKES